MLLQLLIIQIVTFILLLIVLRLLFHRYLSSGLSRLNKLYQEKLAREEELKNELEIARKEKDEELASARKEAERIIKEVKVKAEKIHADAEASARVENEKIIEKCKIDLKKLENELIGKYQNKALDFSLNLIKFIFRQQGKEELQHRLLSEVISEINQIAAEKFTVKEKEVKVLSALALNEEEKRQLKSILLDKIGMEVQLQDTIDPEIIAGLILQVGALTIDGSLRNKLEKAIPYLKASA